MGNMLFNYASTYCIAKKVYMKLIIPKKYKLLKYFNLTPRPVSEIPYLGICSTTKNQNLRRVRVKVAAKYANISMPFDNDVILYGYLQSWKYFNECKDDIRHQLSFKDKNIYVTADLRLKQAMGQLNNQSMGTSTNHTIVGIHVRRGDFVKYSPTGSKSYFQKARDFYRKLYKNVIFVIITDSSNESRSWCLENIVKGSQDTLLLDSSDVIIDLATMWACDHSIISVGTFSWWTAVDEP
ncbi:hypothetical protein FSP39_023799 [Pinctada imbricata]|uniref:L-Fucosyltransferase n=1 Tax=Pinctada imbricata TaxID=66713 RepID=A0AA89BVQ7_PINIB|nr:hypothetical protein FSP39_023799 [Pinctada imbricata]